MTLWELAVGNGFVGRCWVRSDWTMKLGAALVCFHTADKDICRDWAITKKEVYWTCSFAAGRPPNQVEGEEEPGTSYVDGGRQERELAQKLPIIILSSLVRLVVPRVTWKDPFP